jgi:hypothetical protein
MGATDGLAARTLRRLTEIMAVIREIVGFGADGTLVFSQEFPEEEMEDLRPLFDYGDDEQMYAGSYEVSADHRDRVATILGIDLRPDVDYYIEATQK